MIRIDFADLRLLAWSSTLIVSLIFQQSFKRLSDCRRIVFFGDFFIGKIPFLVTV